VTAQTAPEPLNSNSSIDLVGTSLLHFAASTTATGGAILSILDWSGTVDTGGGAEQLKFGSSNSDLSYISQIQFIDPVGYAPGTYAATFATLNPGEVVPVPVPRAFDVDRRRARFGDARFDAKTADSQEVES
jgi:hypothetical protein